jgi:hypothetical protein
MPIAANALSIDSQSLQMAGNVICWWSDASRKYENGEKKASGLLLSLFFNEELLLRIFCPCSGEGRNELNYADISFC